MVCGAGSPTLSKLGLVRAMLPAVIFRHSWCYPQSAPRFSWNLRLSICVHLWLPACFHPFQAILSKQLSIMANKHAHCTEALWSLGVAGEIGLQSIALLLMCSWACHLAGLYAWAMGVPQLFSFLEKVIGKRTVTLQSLIEGCKGFIAVDGNGLAYSLYEAIDSDWVCGGQWSELFEAVRQLKWAFDRIGVCLRPAAH